MAQAVPSESTDPQGLSTHEAAKRLHEQGPNDTPESPAPGLLRRLLGQFNNPLIYLLLVALLVDVGAWLVRDAQELPLQGMVIALILLANAFLGLYQEGRAADALARLKSLAAPSTWTLRDGELRRVPARDLVEGDVVRLEAGDRIPADATLLRPAEGVRVDESTLTGESVPVDHEVGHELLSGTLLVRGTAWLEVVRTGPRSALGRLAQLLTSVELDKSPLERKLDQFGQRVARWVLVLAAFILTAGLAAEGLDQLGPILLFAVALVVAVVPEGLPAVLTTTLSLGVERMARRKAVVRRLASVESLGAVTVIATDKTGTLTENRMQVRGLESPDEQRALRALVLCSDADETAGVGDPLELAIIDYAKSRGLDPAALRAESPVQSTQPFDSRRKFMSVTVGESEGGVSYFKGAPEVLLPGCGLEPAELERWHARAAEIAAEGFRVLALAWRAGPPGGAALGEPVEPKDMSWGGLIPLWDPPREEVPGAIAVAHEAGIRVIMITGDHPSTALAIARQVGIPAERAVAGDELDGLDPTAFEELAAHETVFSRVTPQHKLALVEALQRRGEVVAMTGDGVNDAPALRKADVGVVMGLRGSDVAREAGDVILLDDDFATIVAAVEEGRSIYANIQKFVRFLFASNLAELAIILVGSVAAFALSLRDHLGALLLPLTAAQILWVNLVMETVTGATLAADANPDVMRRPPRDPRAPLLDRASLAFVLGAGGLLALAPLVLLFVLPELGFEQEAARTAAFHTLVVSALFSALWARRLHGSPGSNRLLYGAVALSLGIHATVMAVSSLHPLLSLVHLGLPELGAVGVAVVSALVALEVLLALLRRRQPERHDPMNATPSDHARGTPSAPDSRGLRDQD
jgi:P-type Ca2+ transporter type 2C